MTTNYKHIFRNLALFGILPCFVLLSPLAEGAGVTLVTHGQVWDSDYDPASPPKWLIGMSQALAGRISGDDSIYRITVTGTSSKVYAWVSMGPSGANPTTSDSGEIVVLLDWSEQAGGYSECSSEDIARVVTNFFLQARFPGLSVPVAELPIHIIGHSRGGALITQLAALLGQQGLWVDQVSCLDLHPTQFDDFWTTLGVHLYENVVYSDCYWQNNHFIDDLDGQAIDGAYSRQISYDALEDGGYFYGHSDVHLWYHGTINTNTPVFDGETNLTSAMRDSWYSTSSPNEERGAKTGFHFSRLDGGSYNGGTRMGSGLSPCGTGDREPLTLTASGAQVWDNIQIVDFESAQNVTQGELFQLRAQFSDLSSPRDATITIGLDTDRNPYNGVSGSALLTRSTSAISGDLLDVNLSTSGRGTGDYYVYSKISNGTHTRYYYAKGKLTITSPGVPPTAIILTCNVSASPVAPNYPVTISGTANYNNSGGPVPAGNVNITVGGQTWTASISSGNYSRSIYAPSSPGTYTVSCSALDGLGRSGTSSGSVTVQSNGGTSGYNINQYLTCQSVDSSDPYDYQDEIDAFGHDDAKFYGWLELTDVYGGHTVQFKLYRPDGTYYGEFTRTVTDPADDGYEWWDWYRVYCYWGIQGYDVADLEGRWKLKLYIDGDYKQSIYFTLRYEFKEHRMTKGHNPSDPYDPIDETYTFRQTDQKAETWCKLEKVSNPLEMEWIFYEPNGSQYAVTNYFSTDPNSSGYDYWFWYKYWCSIDIQGKSAANKCGDWRVDVFIKDCWGNWDQEYTDHFRIIEDPAQQPSCSVSASPAYPVETQSATLNVSASDNTYLKSVVLYWNDGSLHSQTWNIIAASLNQNKGIGTYSSGQQVEYWAVATDTSGNSFESAHRSIVFAPETVTTPMTPGGPSIVYLGQSAYYVASGGSSSAGSPVNYQFSWGDGQTSSWGSATLAHTWGFEGFYSVITRACSQPRPAIMSGWSGAQTVHVRDWNKDYDGDGMTDAEESIAGTDPSRLDSCLRVTDCRSETTLNRFVLRWLSASNRYYSLQLTTNLLLGFSAISVSNIPATPPLNTYTDSASGPSPQRFYKILASTNLPQVGYLTVIIHTGYLGSMERWRVNGDSWRLSGQLAVLSPGQYTVDFNPYLRTPPPQYPTITVGQTTTLHAYYGLEPPQNLEAFLFGPPASLYWDEVSGALEYNIWFCNVPDLSRAWPLCTVTEPYYEDYTSRSGVYFFWVRAVNMNEGIASEFSGPVDVLYYP